MVRLRDGRRRKARRYNAYRCENTKIEREKKWRWRVLDRARFEIKNITQRIFITKKNIHT